jgi:hypothetical protein
LGIVSAVTVTTKATSASASLATNDSETESDAEVATMPRAEKPPSEESVSMPFDEDGPVWPSEAAESAFIGEEKDQGRIVPRAGVQTLRQAAADAETALGPLPSLDALIARIPAEARETLEDLFRVKFTGVRRVSKDALK